MSSASQRSVPVSIAAGDSADLDGVMEVMTGAFDATFGEGWTRSQCAGILPLSGVVLTIANDEYSRPRGFSLHRTVADESELLLLAVHGGAQRRGIGSALLDRFVKTSIAAGARQLHLEVRDGNPATAMYVAYGFIPLGRRPNYYRGTDGQLFDAVTMAYNVENRIA